MAALILPERFRHQPQGSVTIDRGNPLAHGLVFAWIPAADLLLRSGAPTRTINTRGVGVTTNGTAYLYQNAAPEFSLSECSVTAILTPNDITTTSAAAVACGSSTNNNPLFILGNGGSANQICFRTRDTANVDILAQATSANWQVGKTVTATGVRSASGGYQRVYSEGALVTSTAAGTPAATTFDRFAIGGLLRSSFVLGFSGTNNLVLIHNRALTGMEVASLAENPWQVFKAPQRRIWVPASIDGGGSHNLLASDSVQPGSLITAPVTQNHIISASPAVALNTASTGVIASTHVIVSSSTAQSNTANSPAITQVFELVSSGALQSNSSESVSVVQVHEVAGSPSSQANQSQDASVAGGMTLTVSTSSQGGVASSSSITQSHSLVPSVSFGENLSQDGVITATLYLASSQSAQGNASPSTGVVIAIALAGGESSQDNTVADAVISQAQQLVPTQTPQGNVLSNSVVAQTYYISGIPLAQVNSASTSAIVLGALIVVGAVNVSVESAPFSVSVKDSPFNVILKA